MTLVLISLVSLVVILATALFVKNEGPKVRTAAWGSCFGHLIAPHILYWVSMGYYGGRQGDFIWFFILARRFNAIYSGERWLAEVIHLATADSTQFMIACAMAIQTLHDSELLGGVLVSVLGHMGQLLLARTTLREFDNRLLVNAATLAPSLMFWTGGFVKEAVALLGIGLVVDAVSRAIHKRNLPIVQGTLGGGIVALVKPYLLFPVAGMVLTWLIWNASSIQRRAALSRPGVLALAGFVAVILTATLTRMFPNLTPEQFSSEVDRLQGLAAGGSTIEGTQGSLLIRVPLGLLFSLFRPQLFDVRNPLMLFSALEVTAATLLAGRLVLGQARATLSKTLASPYLLGALVFTILCGVAVGTTTLNLGTLSRYRVPLIPFFATWLVACSSTAQKSRQP